MQSKEETWLSTILTKHESFRSSLKTIWQGIVSDFEKNIEQMIMKSSFLTGINGSIASSFGHSAPTSAAALGVFAGIPGWWIVFGDGRRASGRYAK